MVSVCSLIVFGGLGFIVCLDLTKLLIRRKDKRPFLSRISLQTKIVFMVTAILILAGILGVFIFENNYTLSAMPAKEKFLSCLFTSITPRTAGFNVLETGALMPTTLFMIIILMFIGASPGSTGGGIKTVTLGILLAALYSMFYNKDRVDLFGKTIPRRTFRNAILIIFLSFGLVMLSAFLLSITENADAKSANYFLSILFESTSAFGTVGLSTGITPRLTSLGKLIIIITMFIGRVGPLTLAVAVAMRKEKADYSYPEENLAIG